MPSAWFPKQAQERAEGLHHRPTTRHGGFAPVRLGSALRLPEGDGHIRLRSNARCRNEGHRNGVMLAGMPLTRISHRGEWTVIWVEVKDSVVWAEQTDLVAP